MNSPFQPHIRMKYRDHGKDLHLRLTKGLQRTLGRIAGRVRQSARRSLKAVSGKRARRSPSRPGEAPHSIYSKTKGGHRLRMILYAQRQPLEWVVGPRVLTSAKGKSSTPTPALHEYGGMKTIVTQTFRKSGRHVSAAQRRAYRAALRSGQLKLDYAALRRRGRILQSVKRVRFPKRPYMHPALQRLIPQIPGMLRNALKK